MSRSTGSLRRIEQLLILRVVPARYILLVKRDAQDIIGIGIVGGPSHDKEVQRVGRQLLHVIVKFGAAPLPRYLNPQMLTPLILQIAISPVITHE